jgi:CRISPR-associated protein Csb2
LVQALVAGVMTGGYRSFREDVEPALRWLERQPPPQIIARPARVLRGYRLAVPNNDMDVIASEWAAGRDANPAELRTMKDVQPREVGDTAPHVRYVWPLDEEAERDPERLLGAAVRLSHCMYALGWGIDMSYADAELLAGDSGGAEAERWTPTSAAGQPLAVPVPGFLDDLEQTYRRFVRRAAGAGVDPDTRPSVYRLQPYGRAGERRQAVALLSLRRLKEESNWPPWEHTMIVAAWMRHAAAEVLKEKPQEWLDSFVLGHTEKGNDPSYRLSFVPLPTVGRYGDGRIRRVMIVEPPGSDGETCRLLAQRLAGRVATKDSGEKACWFAPLDGDGVVEQYVAGPTPARRWHSVTPVVLHGYNASHRHISLVKTERLLLRALEMAGFPASSIAKLAFQSAPLWSGCGSAGRIWVPPHLEGLPRYHVAVEFRSEMPGPVLAGIGRHCGLGSFAARRDELDA